MVHIFIIDANDNPPVFDLDRYNVSITEEQAPGALVANITVHYTINQVRVCIAVYFLCRQWMEMLGQLVYSLTHCQVLEMNGK